VGIFFLYAAVRNAYVETPRLEYPSLLSPFPCELAMRHSYTTWRAFAGLWEDIALIGRVLVATRSLKQVAIFFHAQRHIFHKHTPARSSARCPRTKTHWIGFPANDDSCGFRCGSPVRLSRETDPSRASAELPLVLPCGPTGAIQSFDANICQFTKG
jgi:hypothetical protein